MKNQPDLSTLSVTELQKRVKTTKTATGLLLGLLFIQFAAGIFLSMKQGFNVFLVVPFAFLPLVIVNFNNVKKIKTEIAKRTN